MEFIISKSLNEFSMNLVSGTMMSVVLDHQECPYCIGETRPDGVHISLLEPVHLKNIDILEQYHGIDEQEIYLFHGTTSETSAMILENGFQSRYCCDPSFGNGIYFTPCLKLAASMSSDNTVLLCTIKLGKVDWFRDYCHYNCNRQNIMSTDEPNAHALVDQTEYVVFETHRMIPIYKLTCSMLGL